jgi:hypothetical protein
MLKDAGTVHEATTIMSTYAFHLVASAPLGFWVRDPQAVYGPLAISEG